MEASRCVRQVEGRAAEQFARQVVGGCDLARLVSRLAVRSEIRIENDGL